MLPLKQVQELTELASWRERSTSSGQICHIQRDSLDQGSCLQLYCTSNDLLLSVVLVAETIVFTSLLGSRTFHKRGKC
jgi:hypothetical protein